MLGFGLEGFGGRLGEGVALTWIVAVFYWQKH